MRPDDEVEEEDGRDSLPDIIPTKTNPKLKKGEKPLSQTTPIDCPDCGCDYMIPCIKMFFTKSFAGNRIQNHWPEKDSSNDTALVACPNCGIIFRIAPSGDVQRMDRVWKAKKAKAR